MFSSTFQWKQKIGMWYVVEECVDLKYVNRVFDHVKPNYGSGLGVFWIHLMSCNQILLLIIVVLYLVYYLGIVKYLGMRLQLRFWSTKCPYFCRCGILWKRLTPWLLHVIWCIKKVWVVSVSSAHESTIRSSFMLRTLIWHYSWDKQCPRPSKMSVFSIFTIWIM